MKMIYLSLKMILKQKFLNFFLIVTIMLSISYVSPILSQAIHYVSASRSLGFLDMEQAYYLYKNSHYNRKDPSLQQSVAKKVRERDYVIGYAKAYNLPSTDPSYDVISYDQVLTDKFIPEMDSGVWLKDAERSDYIPAVVSGDLGLQKGDTFPLELISNGVPRTFLCETVGILKPGVNVIGFSGAADNEYFTTDALLRDPYHTVIVPFTEEIEAFTADEAYLLSTPGSILYTSTGTTYEEVLNDFGYAGIIADLDAGEDRFFEQSKLVAAAMGAYFLLYLGITFICILCSNFILTISTRRIYSIYFLVGMSNADRIAIEIIRNFLLIFTSTVFSYLYIRQNGTLQIYFENADPLIILAAILLYTSLIFIPVSAGFIIKNQKTDIMDSIRSLNTEI